MADRLTELQDAINLQAENLGNAVGVIQQLAQPSLFRELNHNGRREKEWASNPEFQALLQSQSQEDNAHKFAVTIATTAKQIELLINSLPAEEASLELQDEVTRQLLSDYRKESAKLVHLITKSFQTRLSKVRQLLSKIAEVQLLTRTLENEVYNDFYNATTGDVDSNDY
ncbi:Mediator of RNA polymerase II transcription [Echinococcus multilocularis]|uniref:Mediator of RNA polymerase II transcription subunit 21 n=1 Tax=Echinococcus multilocularis TaxID=6211 RepID=A0A068Y049_ECHMU|nr:Mediator of RNA polymerase II transcription [Echinococcus multilocularis]